jgi:hypothetical protein
VKDLAGNTIKSELANVIDRRNKIAHESDWDFINNRKYLINRSDIEYVKSFFNDLVNAINNI